MDFLLSCLVDSQSSRAIPASTQLHLSLPQDRMLAETQSHSDTMPKEYGF